MNIHTVYENTSEIESKILSLTHVMNLNKISVVEGLWCSILYHFTNLGINSNLED